MDAKKVAILVGALIVAVVTALLAKNMFNKASVKQVTAAVMPSKPVGPQILVAKRALPVGTIIDRDAFDWRPWPKELVQNAYYQKDDKNAVDLNKLNGTVVRSAITAGQPLTQGALVNPGDRGFLAAALSPGMRAVTVKTSKLAGVAGFVFPGDRIDLLLTQSIRSLTEERALPLNVSETILRNLRVLATDQRTVTTDEQGKQVVKSYQYITLEVTPKMAEKIVVAQSVGAITVSLRSIADNGTELEHAIASGNFSAANAKDAKSEKAMIAGIAARPIDAATTYATGGDVSRFQRRALAKAPAPERSTPSPRRSTWNYTPPAPRLPTMPSAAIAPRPSGQSVTIFRPGEKQKVEFGGN